MTSVQGWRDQRGWIIGAAVLSIWTAILCFAGYTSGISIWIPCTIVGSLILIAAALSGGSDGEMLICSFLFLTGWLCAYTGGYFFITSNYGVVAIMSFLMLFLQGCGFLFTKSLDN